MYIDMALPRGTGGVGRAVIDGALGLFRSAGGSDFRESNAWTKVYWDAGQTAAFVERTKAAALEAVLRGDAVAAANYVEMAAYLEARAADGLVHWMHKDWLKLLYDVVKVHVTLTTPPGGSVTMAVGRSEPCSDIIAFIDIPDGGAAVETGAFLGMSQVRASWGWVTFCHGVCPMAPGFQRLGLQDQLASPKIPGGLPLKLSLKR